MTEPAEDITAAVTAAVEQSEAPSTDVESDVLAALEAQQAPEEVPAGDSEVPAGDEPPLEAYQSWNEDTKALFADKDRDVQQFMLDRQKDMDRAYTEKTTALADERKAFEGLFTPYQELIQGAGYTNEQAAAEALQAYAGFLADPVGTIQSLAQQYGVGLGEAQEDVYTDPQVASLQAEIGGLRQDINQHKFEQHTAYTEQLKADKQADIDAFKAELTDTGEPAHPHFDAVEETMVMLAEGQTAMGNTPDLASLYEQACYINPTVREAILAAQREATAKAEEEAAREKAKQARVAGFNVGGVPEGAVPAEDMSIEDLIRSQLA